jgi:CMP-N,N'-diacetyllegionaminic acid synthase
MEIGFSMKTVSLTLARGGSKGIPRKNLISINNKPLLYYTINNSKLSGVDETWISTEDEEIKQVSLGLGAKVIDRPSHMSEDTSKCEEALMHFAENVNFDILVFLQNTSPLLKPEDIKLGISKVKSGEYDSVFSAYREHWLPRWTTNCKPIEWETAKRPRRQDVSEVYVENGAFYITTKKALLQSGIRYSGKIGVVEMPFSRSFQIDTFDEAELINKIVSFEK